MTARTGRIVSGVVAGALGAVLLGVVGQGAAASVPDAAMTGDREAVRALLQKGADVNAAQGDGVTALHWAATRGDAELTTMLLVAGANVARGHALWRLHAAARGGGARLRSGGRGAGEGRRRRQRDNLARRRPP